MKLLWLSSILGPGENSWLEDDDRWSFDLIENGPARLKAACWDAVVFYVDDTAGRRSTRQALAGQCFGAPALVLEPFSTDESATEWLERGALDVLHGRRGLCDVLDEIAAERETESGAGRPLLGKTPAMQAVRTQIGLVAQRRCNVLIQGETGTGKEVVARLIHQNSGRSLGPWVAVNCAAIPEPLLEAELFGHVRGAFTGAVQGRAGKFEMANRGTIFLDEIGDMPLAIQAKLLRVLQEREVERLGGNDRVKLDVRVLAATNVDLEERVERGEFRQDLFYRLNVVRVDLPPLRERVADIPLLARGFVKKICALEEMPLKHLGQAALDRLSAHSWRGNVRELENAIESAVVMSGDRRVLQPHDFAASVRKSKGPGKELRETAPALPPEGMEYQKALEDFERAIITQALTRVRGNKTAAAELLGLKRTTLSAKLRVLEARMPRLVA